MTRALSQAVCDRAELLARAHDLRTVCKIVGIAESTIWHLKKRGWKPTKVGGRLRARPNDFAIQQRHMTAEQLRIHYRTSSRAVARWRRELRGES
jgi:hypothetical protein